MAPMMLLLAACLVQTAFLPCTAEVFGVPFAKAAIFAAEQPEVRRCDAGPSQNCPNPYGVMATWRYAVNNLRRAVDLLPEEQRQMHKSTVSLVAQISSEIDAFFQQPTAEAMVVGVSNARMLFDALKDWMINSPPSFMELPDDTTVGLDFLPGQRALRISADPETHPGEVEVRLANGVEMPVLGFGTWQLLGSTCYEATAHALRVGYRHIDTAQAYGNEAEVGRAMLDSKIPRREVFLVTKLSNPGEYQAPQLLARFGSQLRDLQTDYIDLYMLHSPGPSKEITLAAWRAMEDLYHQGRIRALGVSNFGREDLESLLAHASVPPVYVQNKFSIYSPGEQRIDTSRSLLGYLKEKGIVMMGYSVINPWPSILPPLQDPHVLAIAERRQVSPSQVLHRWALQLGAGVIPKSATMQRIEENARLFHFSLSDLEMRLLSGIVMLSESTVSTLAPKWIPDVYNLATGVRGVG